MTTPITFITSNADKVRLMQKYLSYPIMHKNINLEEIQSLDVTKVVRHKAEEAYRHLKSPVLVEDTSVVITAFGKLPGPLIKWFVEELGNDGICKLLAPYSDKSAVCTATFGYYDGKKIKFFSATMHGKIANKPQGKNGFGWDPIFIPEGYTKTRAELTSNDYEKTLPRKQAIQKLEKFLQTLKNK